MASCTHTLSLSRSAPRTLFEHDDRTVDRAHVGPQVGNAGALDCRAEHQRWAREHRRRRGERHADQLEHSHDDVS
jgi:hypothetical protein